MGEKFVSNPVLGMLAAGLEGNFILGYFLCPPHCLWSMKVEKGGQHGDHQITQRNSPEFSSKCKNGQLPVVDVLVPGWFGW